MTNRKLLFYVLIFFLALSPVLAEEKKAEVLDWDALVPSDFNPDKLFEKYDLDSLDDADPRAIEFMAELKKVWKAAPVIESMEGRYVRLPGFVVPLETEGDKIKEFFLVPYYGACIHVPPPPANQMVYVVLQDGKEISGSMFDAVWVTGHLSVKNTSNELGDAGYMMHASAIEPYEDTQ